VRTRPITAWPASWYAVILHCALLGLVIDFLFGEGQPCRAASRCDCFRVFTHKIPIGASDLINVSFGPLCGLSRTLPDGREVPISDIADYSMISSAAAEKAIGTSMPSALAVLRLSTNSNLTACITGSSPGLSPLRTRAT
jgi:hypothetical protein